MKHIIMAKWILDALYLSAGIKHYLCFMPLGSFCTTKGMLNVPCHRVSISAIMRDFVLNVGLVLILVTLLDRFPCKTRML